MINAGALMVHALLLHSRTEKLSPSDMYDFTHQMFSVSLSKNFDGNKYKACTSSKI